VRQYRHFNYRDANFRIACDRMEAITAEIVRQRLVLEEYIRGHPAFLASLVPLDVATDAPPVAARMAEAARAAHVGPMAAVAGAMAQLAAEAGLAAGAEEAVVDNGGDVYLVLRRPATVRLYAGPGAVGDRLAFEVSPEDTPLSVCSSSGVMGRSMSLGLCDLATVVARDAALADAAATFAGNQVLAADDIPAALERIAAIPGVAGALLVKGDRVGMIGKLPPLRRA
jgi:ApbE superfamily uncharacterized protein (UPF0280 family)